MKAFLNATKQRLWTAVVGITGVLLAVLPDLAATIPPKVYAITIAVTAAISHALAWWTSWQQKQGMAGNGSAAQSSPVKLPPAAVILAVLIALSTVAVPAHAQTCVIATQGAPISVTITWTAPTQNADGTPLTLPVTYSVDKGPSATALSQIVGGLTVLTFTYSFGMTPGQTYYFGVRAVDANGSSIESNVGCKTFPSAPPKPGAPTGVLVR